MGDEAKKTISVDAARAEAGLALLQKEEDKVDLDVAGATKFKEETDANIAKLEACRCMHGQGGEKAAPRNRQAGLCHQEPG